MQPCDVRSSLPVITGKMGERHALQYLVDAPLHIYFVRNVRSGTCNGRDVGMIRLSGVDGAAGQWKGTRALSLK